MTVFETNKAHARSVAGSWGEAQKLKLQMQHQSQQQSRKIEEEYNIYDTETKLAYRATLSAAIADRAHSPFREFRRLQDSGFTITTLKSPPVEFKEDSLSNPFISTGMTRTMSRSSTRSASVEEAPSRGHANDADEKMSSTLRSSYKNPFPKQFKGIEDEASDALVSRVSLHQTNSALTTSKDAPAAWGRSGPRREKGVSTSGLLGERLMTAPDPRRNSLVQRSWMYADDPALMYKIHGAPQQPSVRDRSLQLPGEDQEERIKLGNGRAHEPDEPPGYFGRKYVYTGDILSKTGSRRAGAPTGVFLDQAEAII